VSGVAAPGGGQRARAARDQERRASSPGTANLIVRRTALAVAAATLLALTAGCGRTVSSSGLPTGTLLLGTQRVPLRVEIAETNDARGHGLMDRTSLPADAGMVFLFDSPVEVSFYMKDTLIPLSIAFWDKSRRIVAILDMTPCRAAPCLDYSPGRSFVGAVEANRGYFREQGIEVGDQVELER
jgi:uncharacterized membrane protein (UPF0127 family)